MIPLTQDQIAILKSKYEDHTEDLRFRTGQDFKLLSGFVTLNLVLAAWLSTHPLQAMAFRVGFMAFSVGVSGATFMLFVRNTRRRKVIVEILHNINEAFGFTKGNAYGIPGPINPTSNLTTTYWLPWYLAVVSLFTLGQTFVIFSQPYTKAASDEIPRIEVFFCPGMDSVGIPRCKPVSTAPRR
ncbi:MAG: hypothetical protein BWY06_00096 [Candidatus Latescibacteria bacterium ADurb.Bin168]|nr:MAG: hypothetical protein BWY06_00096 [Candidatus Latescibacteria bacterium ADurb.Bin168]